MLYSNEALENKTQLVLKALMSLGIPDVAASKELSEQEQRKRGIYLRDFGIDTWDWPQGVGLYGFEKLQSYYGDTRYDEFLDNWFKKNIAEGLPSQNINTTAPYIVLQRLADRKNSGEYKAMCTQRAKWLINDLPKTNEGGFQHVTTGFEGKQSVILNEQQLWVDTLFMAVLFLAREGVAQNDSRLIGEAVHQILLHIKYLYNKQTRLFYHGWSFARNDNFGEIFWNRGNSWFAYGVLELLEALGNHIDSGSKAFILDTYKAQMNALLPLQTKSGLWHTILDDDTSYEEVSGSAAFCAAMFKGMRIGLLDASYAPCAEKALAGVIANIGEDGIVQNVSTGTAMGYDAQHYKDIAIAPIGYGQSMTALALIEAMEWNK